jgi:hypothetical protein
VIDQLRTAAEALANGVPVLFASLFAEHAERREISRGNLWWEPSARQQLWLNLAAREAAQPTR